jgi:alkylation response protein AidB-like acyl-CoA dehydrogenase
MATEVVSKVQGGTWLVSEVTESFSPERLSDDHRMISATAHEFMSNEVVPVIGRLEARDWALARELVAKAGSLGLIGSDVPDDLGGVGLDMAASILVGEAVGRSASFATTVGAETGLAIIPILCFGTPEQKQA